MNETNFAADVAHMKNQVNEMYTALVGNGITKDGGLVKRMDEMELRQELMDKRQEKIDSKQTITGTYIKLLWGAAAAIITSIYFSITKK